jgi:hypothetical protein
MIPTGTVYALGRKHRYHWRHATSEPFVAACHGGRRLNPFAGTPAVSVDIPDRCTDNGCKQRWERWLRDTLHGYWVEAANAPDAPEEAA